MSVTAMPTPEQVRAEPAGPRLNAWVAELVAGLARVGDCPLGHHTCPGQWQAADGTAKRCLPNYSGDIAAAWQIALWLRERWGQFELSAGLEWHCLPSSNPTPPDWGSGETPELAVCRAALLAILEVDPC